MHTRKAFTMLELIFVIVVLGILAAVALPKLAATRDDAMIVKGKSQIAAIRSGIAMQKAKALLQGDNTGIYNNKFRLKNLDSITTYNQAGRKLFNFNDGNESNVLESPILSKTNSSGGWMKTAENNYTFEYQNDLTVIFSYDNQNGTFNCTGNSNICNILTQ